MAPLVALSGRIIAILDIGQELSCPCPRFIGCECADFPEGQPPGLALRRPILHKERRRAARLHANAKAL
jgi:hypothetical protein